MKEATYELKPTFEIISKNDQPAIRCLKCGMISHNYNDVFYKYCGKCKMFHIQEEGEEFTATKHKENVMDFSHHKGSPLVGMRPIEIHIREHGSITDNETVMIVMVKPDPFIVAYGEVSFEMLNNALKDVGYKIEKIK